MKLLFFTAAQSPFMMELIDTLYGYLPDNSSIQVIVLHKLDPFRSHWGLRECNNPIPIMEMPADINSLLEDEKPDCIIFTGYREKSFFSIKRWALKNGKRIYLLAGERINEYKQNALVVWLKYQLFRSCSKGVTGVLAISNRALERYQKYTKSPVIIIPYTFDMTRLLSFTPLPYNGESLVFLISGRLEQFRDPIYSIRLFAELKKLRPNIKMELIISGKGALHDSILSLIKELQIENSVSWINDFKEWSEIHEIYRKAHMLLCFQEYSGWGIIVQEAMAAGLVVACASTVDSADSLIVDGYNGLYCNRVDKESNIKAILHLIDNPVLFNKMRERAREVIQYGDVYHYAKKLANFIQE